jgi:hypothetical protein
LYVHYAIFSSRRSIQFNIKEIIKSYIIATMLYPNY